MQGRKKALPGSGKGNVTGSLVVWLSYTFISISCWKAAEKAFEKRTGDKMVRKRDKWEKGNYRNRVPLTDNTQWVEISDSRKIACVVPLYHPCFLPLAYMDFLKSVFSVISRSIKKQSSYFMYFFFTSRCNSLGHGHHMLWCLNTSHARQCSKGCALIVSVLQNAFQYFYLLSSDAGTLIRQHEELTLEQLNRTIYRNFQWR